MPPGHERESPGAATFDDRSALEIVHVGLRRLGHSDSRGARRRASQRAAEPIAESGPGRQLAQSRSAVAAAAKPSAALARRRRRRPRAQRVLATRSPPKDRSAHRRRGGCILSPRSDFVERRRPRGRAAQCRRGCERRGASREQEPRQERTARRESATDQIGGVRTSALGADGAIAVIGKISSTSAECGKRDCTTIHISTTRGVGRRAVRERAPGTERLIRSLRGRTPSSAGCRRYCGALSAATGLASAGAAAQDESRHAPTSGATGEKRCVGKRRERAHGRPLARTRDVGVPHRAPRASRG